MPIGLVLFAVSYSSFSYKPSVIRLIAFLVALLVSGALIGFAYYERFGYTLMKLAVPRVSNGRLLPGTVELWQLLNNKFQITYESSRMMLPTLFGILLCLALLVLFWIFFRKSQFRNILSYANYYSLALLITVLLFSPLLSWPTQEVFSRISVTSTFKKIGEAVAHSSAPGDKVYIDGLVTAIPLLYAEGLVFLPPQINVSFSFVDEPDSDALLRDGLWNGEIAREWRKQSEVFIIGQDEYAHWSEYIERAGLVSVPVEIDYLKLPDSSKIYIFRRP